MVAIFRAEFNNLQKQNSNYQMMYTGGAAQNIQDCTYEVEGFKKQIKEIEDTDQKQERFEEALDRYNNLVLSIAGAEISGTPKDDLLCALQCNMALCYSNLCDYKRATEILGRIPEEVAKNSELYHYTSAVIIQQKDTKNQYEKALEHLESAISIKPDYYQAIFMRCHLCALLGKGNKESILKEFDSAFCSIAEDRRTGAEAEYCIYRGFICATFDGLSEAYEWFEKAELRGYNSVFSRFNRMSVRYREAVKDLPYGKRIIFPDVDKQKLFEVFNKAKELLFDKCTKEKKYFEVRERTLGIYLTVSSLLQGVHNLCPIEDYLPYVKDAEVFRMLVLGSEEKISGMHISHLEPDDRLFYEVRQLVNSGDYKVGKEKIELLIAESETTLSNSISYLYLQLCLAASDLENYKKYRSSSKLDLPEGVYLAAIDALACELEGDLDLAKNGFDSVEKIATDYQPLNMALQFYIKHGFIQEAKSLYFRIQDLQNNHISFIDDLDTFYVNGIIYFINYKLSSIDKFYANIPAEQISIEAMSVMKQKYYMAVHDPMRLYETLSGLDQMDWHNVFNEVVCCRYMRRYTDGVDLCQKFLKDTKLSDEKNSPVYTGCLVTIISFLINLMRVMLGH